MNRKLVRSSNIYSIGYEMETQMLEVEFKNGTIYQYSDVPKAVYSEFLGASSKGSYFYYHIRNRYNNQQLK